MLMLNLNNLTHSILMEESDNCNSNNNNNNNSLFFNDFFVHHDPIIDNNSLHYAVYDTALFDVLKVDPEDFASQITLMDLPIFQSITPDELISCSWSSKCKLEKSFHIVQFTRRFNQVNFWTQGELLRVDILKNRTEILSHFIRIAKKLFEFNNINGCMAVIMALQSAPIYRLEKTWMGLNKRDRTNFTNLKELFSSNENWKQLREHLSNTKLPCIPYLGIYLTDLIRIDTLHPHRGEFETNQRRNAMNNICRIISEFQQTNYNFLKPIECVQNYLSSVRYIEELQTFIEDQNFKQSLLIESNDQIDNEKLISNDNSTSHRHISSDLNQYSNSSSLTLHCRIREKMSLLDDSVLADSMTEETRSNLETFDDKEKYSSTISLKKSFDYLLKSNDYIQGFVERKCLLKNYKKPYLSQWKKYWLVIGEHWILFYKPKSYLLTFTQQFNRIKKFSLFKNERFIYEENPCKCQSINDCLILLIQTKNRNEIQLSDLNRGSMYKFKFENTNITHYWFERLKQASTFKQNHHLQLSKNLIALD